MTLTLRPAVFLDRDGVLIEDTDYVAGVHQVQFIPGAAEAVAALNRSGRAVVVVTNQSGVARGLFSEQSVLDVHTHLTAHFRHAAQARIDRFEYCPHHPTKGQGRYAVDCSCRKPKPGMLLRAATELGLDLKQSWIVGDRITDLQAGAAAGCLSILVRTGYGRVTEPALAEAGVPVQAILPSVVEAVELILSFKD